MTDQSPFQIAARVQESIPSGLASEKGRKEGEGGDFRQARKIKRKKKGKESRVREEKEKRGRSTHRDKVYNERGCRLPSRTKGRREEDGSGTGRRRERKRGEGDILIHFSAQFMRARKRVFIKGRESCLLITLRGGRERSRKKGHLSLLGGGEKKKKKKGETYKVNPNASIVGDIVFCGEGKRKKKCVDRCLLWEKKGEG